MKDWRGNAIKIGSVVIYPQRQLTDSWMVEAEVIGFDPTYSGVSATYGIEVQLCRTNRTHWMSVKGKTQILTDIDKVTVIG